MKYIQHSEVFFGELSYPAFQSSPTFKFQYVGTFLQIVVFLGKLSNPAFQRKPTFFGIVVHQTVFFGVLSNSAFQ